jgi:beta-lactamase class A
VIRYLVVACVAAGIVLAGGARMFARLLQPQLQTELSRLTLGFDGRIGVCVKESAQVACIHGNQRFPLQSVVKLLVALAVMDSVDHGRLRLEDAVLVRREDLSLAVQPIAALVTDAGFRTTVDDLMRRAIVDSDSAATDIMIRRLGGPKAIQAVLDRLHLADVRIDRDERHLQTETRGLEWRQEYVDAAVLEQAFAAVPAARTDAAFRAYQKDPRDTASPLGMVSLLQSLAEGRLLSASSTRHLLDVMGRTVTFPDRLKAGVLAGWALAHKTGTSGDWRGVTAATNDVGVLRAPDGRYLSVAVFIADSRAPATDRAALMASIARVTSQAHR